MFVLRPYPGGDYPIDRYLQEEWERYQIYRTGTVRVDLLNREPDEIFEGMIVMADGVNWNPNTEGGGFYGRYGGAWVKLG